MRSVLARRTRAIFAVLALAVLASLAFTPVAQAKSYFVSSCTIDATVRADGGLDMVETREFDFSGGFTGAEEYVYLVGPKDAGSPPLTAGGIAFSDSEGPYLKVPWFYDYQHVGASPPGTYMIEPPAGQLHVVWFYQAMD